MDIDTLIYFEDVLSQDVQVLSMASAPSTEIAPDEMKRALNVKLEAIKADVANIQHLLET